MNDPYSDQAKVLASLSAENGLLRAEVERLTTDLEIQVRLTRAAEADVGRLSARIVAIRRAVEGK